MIDKYALYQLANVINNIKQSYGSYLFYKISQIIQCFASVDLSNVYFGVAKDQLYVGGRNNQTRRGCQIVLVANLLFIVQAIAPIVPHMAEDAWQHMPFTHFKEDGSVEEFFLKHNGQGLMMNG